MTAEEGITAENCDLSRMQYPEDGVRLTERKVLYKLSRMAELSGMPQPKYELMWTCTGRVTPGERPTFKVIEGDSSE